MSSIRHIVVALLVGAAAAVQASSSLTLSGVVSAEPTVESATLRVWDRGPGLLRNPGRLFEPRLEMSVPAGRGFTVELENPELPIAVEISAPGYVTIRHEVVCAEQAELPVAFLIQGIPRSISAHSQSKDASRIMVRGTLDVAGGVVSEYPGRWHPAIAQQVVSSGVSVKAPVPEGDLQISLEAVDDQGAWGTLRRRGPVPRFAMTLDSRAIDMLVTDRRGEPVPGVRLASTVADFSTNQRSPAGPPVGTGVVTDEKGAVTLQVSAIGAVAVVAVGNGEGAAAVVPPQNDSVTLELAPLDELEIHWKGRKGPVAFATDLPAPLLTGPSVTDASPTRLSIVGQRQRVLTTWGPGLTPTIELIDTGETMSIDLRGAARIKGRVVTPGGSPVAGVPVWLHLPRYATTAYGGSRRWPSRRPLERPLLPWAVTAKDGSFEIADVPAAQIQLEARRAGLPPARSERLRAEPGAVIEPVLVLRAGARTTVRVVDPEGVPLAGATVAAAVHQGRRGGAFVRNQLGLVERRRPADAESATDVEGHAALEAVPVGTVDVLIERPGSVTRLLRELEIPAQGADLGAQTLEPATVLRGLTVDPDGGPVAEAAVAATIDSDSRFFRPTATSDDEGRFVIEGLTSGTELYLQAQAEGYVAEPPLKVTAPHDGDVEVTMARERVLMGVVVEAGLGSPIAEAIVGASRSAGGGRFGRSMMSAGMATTDGDGGFEIRGLATGLVRLEVNAEGFAARDLEVEIASDRDPEAVTIELEKGLAIHGRVLDPEGAPAVGTEVVAFSAEVGRGSGVSYGQPHSRTGTTGEFRIDGLKAAKYRVMARSSDGATATVVAEAGDDEAVEIRLEATVDILGLVVDPDGRPVAGATVRCLTPGTLSRPIADGPTGADGRFVMRDALAGSHRLAVWADGFTRTDQTVEVTAGRDTEVTIELQTGSVVEGRVLGLSPGEMERCLVLAGSARSQPAADGSFRLEGVPPGEQPVMAMVHPEDRRRSERVLVPDTAEPVFVELDFSGGGRILGIVTRAGRPAPGMGIMAQSLSAVGRESTVSDGDGAFMIADLADGEYEIAVRGHQGSTLLSRTISVNGDVEVELEIPGTELRGWVLVEESRDPVEGARVSIATTDGSATRRAATDASGRFVLRDVPDGSGTLRAEGDGYGPEVVQVAITDDQPDDVTVLLAPAKTTTLVVQGQQGAPPSFVSLLVLHGGVLLPVLGAACDSAGRCQVTELPEGPSVVLVRSAGYGLVAVDHPAGELPVRLRPTGRVVISSDGRSSATRVRLIDTATGLPIPVGSYQNTDGNEWVRIGATGLRTTVPAGAVVVEVADAEGSVTRHSAEVLADGEAVVRLGG